VRGSLYLPWFWLLNRVRRVAVLHASAILWKGRAVLIAGLNGSGKSTILLRAEELGALPLADNYALVSPRGTLFPFPELIRQDGKRPDPPLFRAFGKGFYASRMPPGAEFPIASVLILARTTAFALTPLAARAAVESLTALQRITPEFVDDTPYSFLGLGEDWPSAKTVGATQELSLPGLLTEALREIPAYTLSLPYRVLDDQQRFVDVLEAATAGRSRI
jgi:hypothetical protein